LGWALIAYLCIGWPVEEHLDPELERAGWQQRLDTETFITRR
jgi:5,6-dimethylbenzimidazole synthase